MAASVATSSAPCVAVVHAASVRDQLRRRGTEQVSYPRFTTVPKEEVTALKREVVTVARQLADSLDELAGVRSFLGEEAPAESIGPEWVTQDLDARVRRDELHAPSDGAVRLAHADQRLHRRVLAGSCRPRVELAFFFQK